MSTAVVFSLLFMLISPGIGGTKPAAQGFHQQDVQANGPVYKHAPHRESSRDSRGTVRDLHLINRAAASVKIADYYHPLELDISNHSIHSIDDEELPSNVSILISHHNPLIHISYHAFNESAHTLKAIDIRYHGIKALPVRALNDLTSLTSLTFNHGVLSRINGYIPSVLPSLRYLDLSFNKLTDLTNMSIFQNADTLYQIKLENNNISDISPLYGIKGIMRLTVSGNQICSVKPPTANLTGTLPTTLLYLWMTDNCLNVMPDFTFMTELQVLDLTNNNITNSASDVFPANLIIMDLTNNQLRWIPRTVSALSELRQLTVAGNRISNIDTFVFPSNLRYLWLGKNTIHQIRNTIHFTNHTSLVTLFDVSDNPLTSISDDAFDQLIHLQTLNLTATQLTRLPMALNPLAHLTTLDMNHVTTLTCTCQEAALATPLAHVSYLRGTCVGGAEIKYFLRTLAKQCPSS